MMRIEGVNLPKEKRLEVALTYVYGIGRSLSRKILKMANVSGDKRVHELTENEEQRIREVVSKYSIEGDLRRFVTGNIKRLQEIGTYRGYRHRRKLPVRGQRTRTNARTKRGKRVTMGSGKSKLEKK
ncbi:MAG: 30S ribosomal protein S13 [Candidatus Peregrinibacteria bacterium]